MDITATTAPKSDQQNYDDVASTPRTVTVSEVRAGSSEQPVEIHLAEFPGRPYKPSKSMRRVLVAAWGPEAENYVGRRLTLFGDPTVKFGGQTVGGIKIAALSHLDKKLSVSLTVTKGKRAPHAVEPLPDAPAQVAPGPDLAALASAFKIAGITDKTQMLTYCNQLIGRTITTATELTAPEVTQVMDALKTDTLEDES